LALPVIDRRGYSHIPGREEGLLPCAAAMSRGRDWWFPEQLDARTYTTAAQWGCRACPSVSGCLEDALALEDGLGMSGRHGVWGGMTAAQRLAEDRRRKACGHGKPPLRGYPPIWRREKLREAA
jgi:hypothetical protein